MNRRIVLPAAVVLCLAVRVLFAQDRARPPIPSDPEIEVVPVASGVYAVLRSQHPDEQPGHSNSVIIINDDGRRGRGRDANAEPGAKDHRGREGAHR